MMIVKTTTEDFIKKAISTHGSKYDYSKVKYITSKAKVTIICPIHGEFEQIANNHTSAGKGCPVCGRERQLPQLLEINRVAALKTIEQSSLMFVEKAIKKHGNKYDYSKAVYTYSTDPIEIICSEHGSFWQQASNHLSGYGCPKCAKQVTAVGWSRSDWKRIQRERTAKLYCVKLKNKDTTFIKIGITYGEVKNRIQALIYKIKDKTYTFEILKVVESLDSDTIYNLEKKSKKDLKEFKMKFDIAFHGKTECYKISKTLLKYIANI